MSPLIEAFILVIHHNYQFVEHSYFCIFYSANLPKFVCVKTYHTEVTTQIILIDLDCAIRDILLRVIIGL